MSDPFTTPTHVLKKRHLRAFFFRWIGRLAIIFSFGFLLAMIGIIGWAGAGALKQTYIGLTIDIDPADLEDAPPENLDYDALVKQSLRNIFPEVKTRREKRDLYRLLSSNAPFTLKDQMLKNPEQRPQPQKLWFLAADDVDMFIKGNVSVDEKGAAGRLNKNQLSFIRTLERSASVQLRFSTRFFTSGDSREPELAGILSSFAGTAFTLLVTFLVSFPLGVGAAIFLEEFTGRSPVADFIEVNIANLAAIPSIVYGILGLSVFLNTLGLPRSSPLVGGLVLALMTLPTIIIASRAALRSVPPSIREAAFGVGANDIQTVFQHVVPLALPGMLTGTIVGMAKALGETAPLLMIGMVAFIVDVPNSVLSPATALPVQIFLWADSPERAFMEKTSAAIIVLLVFLVLMNLAAIILRSKYRKRF